MDQNIHILCSDVVYKLFKEGKALISVSKCKGTVSCT